MRCFVALELPPHVRAAVAQVAAGLRAARAADVRWVEPGKVHLTLKFLGSVPDERVPVVAAAVGAAAADVPSVALTAGGLGTFPGPGRPRVVWVGVTAGGQALVELVDRIDHALAALGHPPEGRPFRGHLTLGRVRSPRGRGALARAIERADAAHLGAWTAREVVLFESRLRPTGAEYHVVSRHPLRGGTSEDT